MKKIAVIFILLICCFSIISADDVEIDDATKQTISILTKQFTPRAYMKSEDMGYAFFDNPAALANKRLITVLPGIDVSLHQLSSLMSKNSDELTILLSFLIDKKPETDVEVDRLYQTLLSLAKTVLFNGNGITPFADVGIGAGFQIGGLAVGYNFQANLNFKNDGTANYSILPTVNSVLSVGYGTSIFKDENVSFDIGLDFHLNNNLVTSEIPLKAQKGEDIFNLYDLYEKYNNNDDYIGYVLNGLSLYEYLSLTNDLAFRVGLFDNSISCSLIFNDFRLFSDDIKTYASINDYLKKNESPTQITGYTNPDYFRISYEFKLKPFAKVCSRKYLDMTTQIGISDLSAFAEKCSDKSKSIALSDFEIGLMVRVLDFIEVRYQKIEGNNSFGATVDIKGNRIEANYGWHFEKDYGNISDDTFTIKVTLGYED